ncbi:24676_t:CDS:2 [Gigaspora margarita]|uniref:24676_t:CDS:1 n=1 Tax=Gigaspora margarita TaxID=4874 RepID=A0ABM8VX17_GIGMA|nr:24676_t:CDS:2 [Gigaspora margarita]
MTITSSNPGGKRPNSSSVDANSREKRLKTIACDRCRRRKVNNLQNLQKSLYIIQLKYLNFYKKKINYSMIVKDSKIDKCTYGKNAGRSNTNQSQIASNRANVSSQSNRNPTRSKSTTSTINGQQSTSRQRRGSNTQSNQNTRTTKKASSSTINTSFSIVTSSSNTTTNSNRIIPQALPLPDNVDNVFEYTVKLFVSISPQNEDQVRQQFNHYISQVQDEKSSISISRQLNLHDTQKLDDLSQRLVNLYFDNFHPSLPVLSKAYFFEGFRDINKSMPRILLYAVCAIGSNYLDDATIRKDYCDSYSLGLEYFELAQDMINQNLNYPKLSTAAALLLLGMFQSRSFKGYTYTGMAAIFATAMRLQDKNASEGLSANKKEARKRLWWGIVIHNNLQSIALNRVSTLSAKCCTLDLSESESSSYVQDEFELKIMDYFVQYFKITKITYEIVESSLTETNENMDNIISRFEEKLNNWKKDLPPSLQIENCGSLTLSTEITIDHLRVYLCILYNYAMIRIHHVNITSDNSMVTCAKAANDITTFINKNFLLMTSSTPFIIHSALYAGFIHILNLKKPMCATEAKHNIIQTLKLFQNALCISSSQYMHSSIKYLIAILTSQLECMTDTDEETLNVAKTILASISNNISSNISSNISGNISSNISSNISGNISSNISSNISGNISSNISGNISASTRSPQYSPISPITPWISHQNHQTNQQQRQSVFATSPAPLSPIDPPPVNSNKLDSNSALLMVDNYSSQYGHSHNQQSSTQSRQHENTTNVSNWHYQWSQSQQHHHTSSHNTSMSQNPSDTSTLLVIGNSSGSSTSPLTISRNATSSLTMPSSLPPLGTAIPATNTTSSSMQYYLTSNNTSPPSNNMGISGNYVTGTEISGGLAGISSIGGIGSENSVPMLDWHMLLFILPRNNHRYQRIITIQIAHEPSRKVSAI